MIANYETEFYLELVEVLVVDMQTMWRFAVIAPQLGASLRETFARNLAATLNMAVLEPRR